ncbi:MAG: MerR family DNA-binding protein [Psychrobium sp.]
MKTITEVGMLLSMPVKTIRYYDDIGLLGTLSRANNGYRQFNQRNIEQLKLIQGARNAGFSIGETRDLLALFNNENRVSRDVKAMTHEKIIHLKSKIESLNNVLQQLESLHDSCAGDDGKECAILDGLSKSCK